MFLLAAGALAGCSDSSDPDVGSVGGTIRDAATDAPLAAATVVVAGVEGRTGSDGSYRLDGVPVGAHEGTTTRTGYVSRNFEAEVRPGAMTTVSLEITDWSTSRSTTQAWGPMGWVEQ